MSSNKIITLAEKFICQEVTSIVLEASEKAALACFKLNGMGQKNEADRLAVEAMRETLKSFKYKIKVVIGEGEMDEAPMLFIGEELGNGEHYFDLAVDPLEGTNLCANNMPNSITCIAIAEKGGFLAAPDCYMQKIAAGGIKEKGIIDISFSIEQNIINLAKYKNKKIEDISVVMLGRERHKEDIAKIRKLGAKVSLISDGDIYGVISSTFLGNGADLYYGTGGAPEGVLAAAAIKACGGRMMGKLIFENEEQKKRAISYGIKNPEMPLELEDMVKGNCIFVASGVTDGEMLKSPTKINNFIKVESIIFTSIEGKNTIKKISNFTTFTI